MTYKALAGLSLLWITSCGTNATVTALGGTKATAEAAGEKTVSPNPVGTKTTGKNPTGKTKPPVATTDPNDPEETVLIATPDATATHKTAPGDAVFINSGGNIQGALDGLKNGGTLVLRDGTYNGKITLARDNITLMAEHDGKAIVQSSGGLNMHVTANKVTIQGIVFDGGSESGKNSAANDYAANIVERDSTGTVLQDCTFRNSKGVGLSLDGDNITATRLVAHDNGASGIGGSHGSDITISYSLIYHNNYKEYKSDGGGGKFTRADKVTFDHVESYDNIGPGIWFDIYNTNMTVKNCYVHDNKGHDNIDGKGIMFELSGGDKTGKVSGMSYITNNVVENNDANSSPKDIQRGILISSTANVVVENNTVTNDTICLKDGSRELPTKNVTVKNNKLINTEIKYDGAKSSCCSVSNNDSNAAGATSN